MTVCSHCHNRCFCFACIGQCCQFCRNETLDFCNVEQISHQSPSQIAETVSNVVHGRKMFETIFTVFDMLLGFTAVDTSELIEQIKQVYRTLPGLSMMSRDECELLLNKLNKIALDKDTGFGMRNLLVALCRQPWAIDVNLGTHGICYYGASGQVPNSFIAVLQLLSTNDRLIRGNRDFVRW